MWRASLLVVFSALVLFLIPPGTADGGADKKFRPLDLSVAVRARADEEDEIEVEENAPEVILFYGQEREGNAFFWCLDRSGSMSGENLLILKEELLSAIRQLSSATEFGIVWFCSDVKSLSPAPMKATAEAKALAIAFVTGIQSGGGTNYALGITTTLEISNQCTNGSKRIIVVGDGLGGVESTIQAIDRHNAQATPMDCVLVRYGHADAGMHLFLLIASRTGGQYVEVR